MRTKRLWLASFACFFLLGASWALSSPLLSVPDEPAHLVKSAAVVRGELSGRRMPVPDEGPGSISRGGFTMLVPVPYSYTWQTSEIPNCFIYEPQVPAGCAPPFEDIPRAAEWVTWVGAYPPAYYAAVGWPTLLDTGRLGVYLVRLVSAAICAAFLATALSCASSARSNRVLALGVVVAVTPMVLFLSGAVNPNGLEIATAVCFWTAFGALLTWRDRSIPGHLFWSALASGVALTASRPLAVLWLAVAAGVLLVGFGSPRDLLGRLGRRRVTIAAVVLGAASVIALVWSFGHDSLGNVQGDEPRGLDLFAALRHSAGRTPDYLQQMVGVFGWRSTTPPLALVVLWTLALACLVVVALFVARNRPRLALLGAGALTIGLPALMEAAQAHDRGFPWQGRYGLPLAVGVAITAALAIADGRPIGWRATRILAGTVVGAVTIGQVLAHVAAMRRYVVGSDGPWWYLSEHGWEPPLPSWFLLVLVLTGAAGLAALTLRTALGGDDRDDEPDGPQRPDGDSEGQSEPTRAPIPSEGMVAPR